MIQPSDWNDRLCELLTVVKAANPFYQRKLAGVDPRGVKQLGDLPCTTKQELVLDQQLHPPFGSNLTRPIVEYVRMHQTSGTSTGRPLRWLDTRRSWGELLRRWQAGFELIGLTPADRLFFPFSFGPFLGFWSAFEAGTALGCLCLSGSGMTSTARLSCIIDLGITVLFITPTYALHLQECASRAGIDLRSSAVRALVLAGEPGGSLPGTRTRIETAWGARVFDHYGLTELGPLAFEPVRQPGMLQLLKDDCIFEVLVPGRLETVPPGQAGELVVTGLTRVDSPLIRYRTGDIVQLDEAACGLIGGVLGRADEMLHVRGNNIYPTAIENIVRGFEAVAEFRITVDRRGALAELLLEIETISEASTIERQVADALRDLLGLRVMVQRVASGTLPRFEMKARRVRELQ